MAALAGATLAAPLAAQDSAVAQRELGVAGRAPEVCTLGQGRFKVSGLDNFTDTAGDTLQVVQLLDPRDLSVRGARATVALAAVCNFPHRVRVESQDNGLWPVSGPLAADSGGFASALPYALDLHWADISRQLQMTAQIRRPRLLAADVDQPAAGDLVLDLQIDEGASNAGQGAPVLAGSYTDTVRIYLEPR